MPVSREIQIGHPCPHLIIEEVVALGSDQKSLITRAPVSSANSVRIMVNNEMYVPPGGLYSQATLSGAVGPYRIENCVGFTGPDGNTLTVTASQGTVTVSLPTSKRVSADVLVRHLRLTDLQTLVSVNVVGGSVTFTDIHETGPRSVVRVQGDGATALGFIQRGTRGREIYPGWTLVSRDDVLPTTAPRGLIPVAARYPRFKKPVPNASDFKVTYAAMPERCPRCGGTYIENDYRFTQNGDVRTIVNEDLLYQSCLKMILTRRGSNPYHTGYGSRLMERIGGKSATAAAGAVRQDIIQALKGVQGLQTGQRKFQQVTNRERLYRIEDVTVTPSATDPTTFVVGVAVTNGSNQPVSLNIVYSAPGAVALAGSNGQSLGSSGMSRSQAQRFLLDG
jgi:hypothetical protein